jgi:hypothetical protein
MDALLYQRIQDKEGTIFLFKSRILGVNVCNHQSSEVHGNSDAYFGILTSIKLTLP